MILSLIRFPLAVVGQAVDIFWQMHEHNKLVAAMHTSDPAADAAVADSALTHPPVSADRPSSPKPPGAAGSHQVIRAMTTCVDTELRAQLWNEGYQEAMQHQTGGAEHRAWLVQTAEQIIARWVETGYRTALAGLGDNDEVARKMADQLRHLHLAEPWLPASKIADALLSEIDFTADADPTP